MFNTLGGNSRGGGMSPIMLGLMGLLAYRTLKGKGKLADMLGTNQTGTADRRHAGQRRTRRCFRAAARSAQA